MLFSNITVKTLDHEAKENNCDDCSNNNSDLLDVDESKDCSCSSSNSCNKNELDLNCYSCEQLHHSPERSSPHCQDDISCTNDVWIDDCKCDNEADENKGTLMICKCCNRWVYLICLNYNRLYRIIF